MVRSLAVSSIKGSAEACGREYGEMFELPILAHLARKIRANERNLAYAKRCWPYVQRDTPVAARFMRGFAKATGLSIELVTLLSLNEELWHQPHCTAFVATGSSTRSGETMVGMNWDVGVEDFAWAGLLRLHVKGSPRMAMYHVPGLWACAGINEHGLAMMWTSTGISPKLAPRTGVPSYVIIFEMLRERNVTDAISFLRSIRHAGSFNFLLADARGNVAVVEAMPGAMAVEQSGDVMSRANHYQCPAIVKRSKQQLQPQINAFTCERAARMEQLLKHHHGRITDRVGRAMLHDRHGKDAWIHALPRGAEIYTRNIVSIDSLLALCDKRSLLISRGGRVPGPWQTIEA